MAERLSREQVLRLRMRSQRLHPRADASVGVAQLVRVLCGVQAQVLSAASLAIRARSQALVDDEVTRAREVDRSVVLTWCMRGTLHLVSSEDVGWLLGFLGPISDQKSFRRYAQLGLDSDVRDRATRVVHDVLAARGPLTRAELAESLAAQAIPVAGQAIAHIIGHAALVGVICHGPRRGGQPTYVLLEDWIQPGKRLDDERALAELVRRYLAAYGPATPADMASWAGIAIGQARAGFDAVSRDLVAMEVAGSKVWALARGAALAREAGQHSAAQDGAGSDAPVVRLLPSYDLYLLGYRSRDAVVDSAYARRIHPGGGQINPTVIVDGRAVATWRISRRRGGLVITIEPFGPVTPEIVPGLEAEVRDIGRFLRQEARLEVRSTE